MQTIRQQEMLPGYVRWRSAFPGHKWYTKGRCLRISKGGRVAVTLRNDSTHAKRKRISRLPPLHTTSTSTSLRDSVVLYNKQAIKDNKYHKRHEQCRSPASDCREAAIHISLTSCYQLHIASAHTTIKMLPLISILFRTHYSHTNSRSKRA